MSDVKLLARWDGWCDACETERPLVLTETGEHGLRAWMRGVGPEDRELTLTCGVCGEWQAVSHDDEDDDVEESAAFDPIAAVRRLGARQVVVSAAFQTYPVEALPEPRSSADDAEASSDDASGPDPDAAFDLLAEGLDLISLAS